MKIIIVLLFFLVIISGCQKTEHISLWDRHCGACHDGKTVLNGQVVMDKEQMKKKYKSSGEFADACSQSPTCMNIMKHKKSSSWMWERKSVSQRHPNRCYHRKITS